MKPFSINEDFLKTYMKENSTYGAHMVASLVERLISGAYQRWIESKYLQNYLDNYVRICFIKFREIKASKIGHMP